MKGQKAIFAFRLDDNRLEERPAYVIDEAQLKEGKGPFKPAGIAVHPAGGDLYVVSSVRKVMVVLRPDGSLADEWSLEEAGFAQPEALAFTPEGALLVGSERGGGEAAALKRFRRAP